MLFQLSYSSVASGLFLVLAWFHLVTIITVEVRLSAATLFLFRSRFVTLPAIALSADTENDNCFARQDVVVEEPARRNSFSEVLHRDDSSPPPVPPLPLDYSVKGTGKSRGMVDEARPHRANLQTTVPTGSTTGSGAAPATPWTSRGRWTRRSRACRTTG
jgi:hypothetical protein